MTPRRPKLKTIAPLGEWQRMREKSPSPNVQNIQTFVLSKQLI